jgi:hypothetical protein
MMMMMMMMMLMLKMERVAKMRQERMARNLIPDYELNSGISVTIFSITRSNKPSPSDIVYES